MPPGLLHALLHDFRRPRCPRPERWAQVAALRSEIELDGVSVPHRAFAALTESTGARRYYDLTRERQKDHEQALRAVGNRLVGILDGCLRHRQLYSEAIAWPNTIEQETAA